MAKLIICILCGEEKPHEARGLCRRCYQQQPDQKDYRNKWYQMHKSQHKKSQQQWEKENQEERRKYHRELSYKNGKHQSMNENKFCSSYLGIHMAEKVLSKIFKNIEVMPNNNPSFDFICGKGYKVDVKSGCQQKNNQNESLYSWRFHIDKNQISDYFLCLAFDNRNNLNPLYCWLIPNKVINNKTILCISKSNLSKWSKYEQPIDKVISYCNTLRGD